MGRPPTPEALTALVLEVAIENRTWGYERIAGALENLGHRLSRQTVANILKKNGLEPAPSRGRKTSWKDFIRCHLDVLAAADFFTAEVRTPRGLVTYYVLFILRLAQRQVRIAGITSAPDGLWMEQIGRSLTFAEEGFLANCRYLIHDRDTRGGAGDSRLTNNYICSEFVAPLNHCHLPPWPPSRPSATANGRS